MSGRTISDMWRVTSKDGTRWVQHNGVGYTADDLSEETMASLAGRPVRRAPMCELYMPTGPTDPIGLYLLARAVVPGPHTVNGMPPAIPAAAAGPERVF